MSRTAGPPRAADPYGIGPVRSLIAPVASVVGLLVVAFFTLSLLNGNVPLVGAPGGPNASGDPGVGVTRTPAPSNVIVVEPEAAFPGSIVYAKAGNIWIQSGKDVRQLTSAGLDSMPSWSPDGQTVYFIRTVQQIGTWPSQGRPSHYLMTVPSVMSVKADGSASAAAADQRHHPQGQPRMVRLDPRAGRLAGRQDPRAGLRRSRSHEVGRRPPDLRHREEEVDDPRHHGGRATGPPGPRLEAGRLDPGLRPQQSRRPEGDAGDLPLGRQGEEGDPADRPRLPRAELLAGRQVPHGHEDRHLRLRHRDHRRVARPRAPAGDQ